MSYSQVYRSIPKKSELVYTQDVVMVKSSSIAHFCNKVNKNDKTDIFIEHRNFKI